MNTTLNSVSKKYLVDIGLSFGCKIRKNSGMKRKLFKLNS